MRKGRGYAAGLNVQVEKESKPLSEGRARGVTALAQVLLEVRDKRDGTRSKTSSVENEEAHSLDGARSLVVVVVVVVDERYTSATRRARTQREK